MVNPTSEFPKQLFWPDYKIQLQDWEMFPSSYHYYDFSTSPIWSLFTINSRPNHRSCPLQRLIENCLLFTTGGPRVVSKWNFSYSNKLKKILNWMLILEKFEFNLKCWYVVIMYLFRTSLLSLALSWQTST